MMPYDGRRISRDHVPKEWNPAEEHIAMKIWELRPIDPSHRNWRASTYKGSVIIRAPDEERARWIAKLALDIATEGKLGEDVVFSPWGDDTVVGIQERTDSGYPDNGPEAILDPPEYDHEWQR